MLAQNVHAAKPFNVITKVCVKKHEIWRGRKESWGFDNRDLGTEKAGERGNRITPVG